MGGRGSVGRPRVLFFRRFGGGRRRGFASRRGRGGHDDAPWNHHSRRHLWLLLGCLGFLGRWPFLVVVGLLFSTWNLLLSCMTVPSSVTLDGLGFDFGNLIEEGVQIVGHLPLARRSVSQSNPWFRTPPPRTRRSPRQHDRRTKEKKNLMVGEGGGEANNIRSF